MSFNKSHTVRCAINSKNYKANCTCGFTEKWRGKKIIELRAELTTAKKQILDYEQIEASVCPEDVGIKEYVANLQAKFAEAKEEVKAGRSLWTEAQAGRKKLRLELDTASHENKRLRDKIDEAIDVLPTYPGCAKQCLIKALTGE